MSQRGPRRIDAIVAGIDAAITHRKLMAAQIQTLLTGQAKRIWEAAPFVDYATGESRGAWDEIALADLLEGEKRDGWNV